MWQEKNMVRQYGQNKMKNIREISVGAILYRHFYFLKVSPKQRPYEDGMLLFMEVMVTRMQQAGEVIVPYITENPFMSEEQISKVKAGDTISLDHDVRLKIETVKDSDEKEWIGVFTSSEEMHKGSAGNVQMNQSIESILRLALNWEQVNGIVINPFGKYIQMTKKMIELLINGYEYNENERKSKDDENN